MLARLGEGAAEPAAEPATSPGRPMRGQRQPRRWPAGAGGDAETPMTKLNMVKALNLALLQEMERDPDVLVLGEDVGVDGGVFRVTEDLHAEVRLAGA